MDNEKEEGEKMKILIGTKNPGKIEGAKKPLKNILKALL